MSLPLCFEKEQEMSMEIYSITAGALFLFIMESSVSIPENGTLRLPDSGWWRGSGTFDDSCDKRRSDAKAFVFLCGGNMDPFSCGGVFYCTCHERLEERRTAGI